MQHANPDWLRSALSESLTAAIQHNRAPHGFDPALKSLRTPSEVSLAFRAVGFWAWLAYGLATHRHQSIEQSLSDLEGSILDSIVTEVSKVKPSNDLVASIEHALYASNRAGTRLRLLQTYGIEPPARLSSSSTSEPNPPKRPRLEPPQQNPDGQARTTGHFILRPMDTNGLSPADDSDALPAECAAAEVETGRGGHQTWKLPPFRIQSFSDYAYPKTENLPFVFPHPLSTKMVKKDYKASLMMTFPTNPDLCRLIFDMDATEVQYLSMKLFGVKITSESNQRCISLDHGAAAKIIGGMELEYSKPQVWGDIFGETISTALKSSPRRVEEILQGDILSKCVLMLIPGEVDQPARLILSVHPIEIAVVHNQLWKS